MDELLRALPGIAIVLGIIGVLVLAGRMRNRTISILEANAKQIAQQTELRRREVDVLERIAVALESKKDQSHSG
jgi:hypothetical protein